MIFNIRHKTNYRYSRPVLLGPQTLRFRPRSEPGQHLLEYHLKITPEPVGRSDYLDIENNPVTRVWFNGETDSLQIDMQLKLETLCSNPFDYLLSDHAERLPLQAPQTAGIASAYLLRDYVDASVNAFAEATSHAANYQTTEFLNRLNLTLFNDFKHFNRETGAAQTPAVTLHNRSGACRDLAVLFVDCCRYLGIPARFASGYQKGNLQSERRHLHAWPEVYLPGAGWRGYDPTHGIAIADSHVTVAAAAAPRDTMPVSGSFTGPGATSSLDYSVKIAVNP